MLTIHPSGGRVIGRIPPGPGRSHPPVRAVNGVDLTVARGEFFAFMLLSLCGAMLIPGSPDLIWLFLALELTSLPTYIMVAMTRGTRRAQEAAVKYFFLGALSTAIIVYGFAMLYGSTGSLQLAQIRAALGAQMATGGIDAIGTIGLLLVTLGLCFKLAAAPMHFYAPDVYEGAAAPVKIGRAHV